MASQPFEKVFKKPSYLLILTVFLLKITYNMYYITDPRAKPHVLNETMDAGLLDTQKPLVLFADHC